MPLGSRSVSSPIVDMGHPFLNHTFDAFFWIGIVGLAKSAIEEAWQMSRHGSVSKSRLQHSLKRMCKEGALWGTVAGVYVGLEYGVGKMLGTSDWKNAMIAGALAGAVVTAVTNNNNNNNKDRIVANAITGGALATAAVFLRHLT